jgi:hypothetical protein
MRAMTHSDIIARHGNQRFADVCAVPYPTAASWRHRGGIPVEHWPAIVREGLATMDELRDGAKPGVQARLEAVEALHSGTD